MVHEQQMLQFYILVLGMRSARECKALAQSAHTVHTHVHKAMQINIASYVVIYNSTNVSVPFNAKIIHKLPTLNNLLCVDI